MRKPKPPPKPLLVVVTVRLHAGDVEALKRVAYADGELEWQPRLRRLVHEALREKKVLR
jgi:hypothetical protein